MVVDGTEGRVPEHDPDLDPEGLRLVDLLLAHQLPESRLPRFGLVSGEEGTGKLALKAALETPKWKPRW